MSPKSFRSESEMSAEQVSYLWKQVHCYPVALLRWCNESVNCRSWVQTERRQKGSEISQYQREVWSFPKWDRSAHLEPQTMMLGVWKWHGTKSRWSVASRNSVGLLAWDLIVITAPTCVCARHLSINLSMLGSWSVFPPNFLCKCPFPACASWLRILNVPRFPPAPRSL